LNLQECRDDIVFEHVAIISTTTACSDLTAVAVGGCTDRLSADTPHNVSLRLVSLFAAPALAFLVDNDCSDVEQEQSPYDTVFVYKPCVYVCGGEGYITLWMCFISFS
jgi:hypothetical protein